MRTTIAIAVAATIIAVSANAHQIHLKSGRIVETDVVFEKNGVVYYKTRGEKVGIESETVEKIVLQKPKAAKKPLSPREIFQTRKRAVVMIYTESGSGTGFLSEPDGTIITNRHIADIPGDIMVKTYDQKVFKARRIVWSTKFDIAVLKIPPQHHCIPIKSAPEITERNIGEAVYIIGNPAGFDFTISRGIISQVRTDEKNVKYIQTDAAISKGSSGSPVFDRFGNCIAVLALKHPWAESISLAIAVENINNTRPFQR